MLHGIKVEIIARTIVGSTDGGIRKKMRKEVYVFLAELLLHY
jgi:hypothetical protein